MPTIFEPQAERLGYPHNKYFIQTILINKRLTKREAIKWLKEHGFKYDDYRTERNFHRFMQTYPVHGALYFTKRITPDIQLVFQLILYKKKLYNPLYSTPSKATS